jgi:hypothetical protein
MTRTYKDQQRLALIPSKLERQTCNHIPWHCIAAPGPLSWMFGMGGAVQWFVLEYPRFQKEAKTSPAAIAVCHFLMSSSQLAISF